MNEASGYFSRKTMVSGAGASTASTFLYWAWRLETTVGGGLMMRS